MSTEHRRGRLGTLPQLVASSRCKQGRTPHVAIADQNKLLQEHLDKATAIAIPIATQQSQSLTLPATVLPASPVQQIPTLHEPSPQPETPSQVQYLKPLSPQERDCLLHHDTCFRCRGHGHKSFDPCCPNNLRRARAKAPPAAAPSPLFTTPVLPAQPVTLSPASPSLRTNQTISKPVTPTALPPTPPDSRPRSPTTAAPHSHRRLTSTDASAGSGFKRRHHKHQQGPQAPAPDILLYTSLLCMLLVLVL